MSNEHLGGHCNRTWIDQGAVKWAKDKFGIRSILDIGCGPGGMIEVCEKLGIDWHGIDGDPSLKIDHTNFVRCDFCKGSPSLSKSSFDLGWSVEFLEHVEEEYQKEYMNCFQLCKYVIATAAPPGFRGHHHVNERHLDYWVETFGSFGFEYSDQLTNEMKTHSTMIKKAKRKNRSFIDISGMFFNRIN